MIQESKELLLKNFSARLLYRPIMGVGYDTQKPINLYVVKVDLKAFTPLIIGEYCDSPGSLNTFAIEECRLYLRPLSSMTEEEKKEYELSMDLAYAEAYGQQVSCAARMIDFFNKHHFDYEGLIPKGLALVASEGMYK